MMKKVESAFVFRCTVAALACLASLLGLAAHSQLERPLRAPTYFAFSESLYAKAAAAHDAADAISFARRTVQAAPARAENWVLLAYTYHTQDLRLSQRVLSALRRSYQVSALSPDAHDWRLRYIFSNWTAMPLDLRRLAMSEAEAYSIRYAGRTYIAELLPEVRDDNGRLALGLVLVTRINKYRSKG